MSDPKINPAFVLAVRVDKYLSSIAREWTKEEEELVELSRKVQKEVQP